MFGFEKNIKNIKQILSSASINLEWSKIFSFAICSYFIRNDRVEKQAELKLHFLKSWGLIGKLLSTLYSSISQQIMQPEVFQVLMLFGR